MKSSCIMLCAFLTAAAAGAAAAAESVAPLPLPVRLAGHTLNAYAYVSAQPGVHHGRLARLMLQAYLGPGGRALVRVWDSPGNAYTPIAERSWSIEGNTLCFGLPGGGAEKMCADVHVWGPRIAGAGVNPYVQIEGDLQPGNTIGGRR
jgi:hypothetical protein